MDPKTTLVTLLTTLLPLLPLPLRLPAAAILALLKSRSFKFAPPAMKAAPSSVHEYVSQQFDGLIAALHLDNNVYLAKVTTLLKRYVLTALTDAAWDTIAAKIGFASKGFTTTLTEGAVVDKTCGCEPIKKLKKELAACEDCLL